MVPKDETMEVHIMDVSMTAECDEWLKKRGYKKTFTPDDIFVCFTVTDIGDFLQTFPLRTSNFKMVGKVFTEA